VILFIVFDDFWWVGGTNQLFWGGGQKVHWSSLVIILNDFLGGGGQKVDSNACIFLISHIFTLYE
jgi:hypothetical protein